MPRRTIRSLWIVFFLAAVSGLFAEETSHTVREGETLFSIARGAHIPVRVLHVYNGIDNPRRLRTGIVIRFPSSYVVKKGDTLYGIAHSHGVELDRLLNLNGMSERGILTIGTKLFLPFDSALVAAQRGRPRAFPSSKTVWPHGGRHEPLRGKISGLVFFGSPGDAVRSATSGEVKWTGPYWGWGKTVIIKSPDGHFLLYAGNARLLVHVGDHVKPGTEIARLGVSPEGGGAKLYFSIQGPGGRFINPSSYLSRSSAPGKP